MKLGAKLTVAFVLGLLIIGAVGIQSYRAIQRLTETNRRVVHTHEVLEKLDNVQLMLTNAETGARGFVLTGEEPFLAPHNAAAAEISKDIASVKSLTQDNPEQQGDVEQLEKLSSEKLDVLQGSIERRREEGLEAALPIIRSDRGEQIMDDFRALVAQMEQREAGLLDARTRAAGEVARQSLRMLGFGVLLSLAILGIAAVIVIRTMRLADRGMRLGGAGSKWPGTRAPIRVRGGGRCAGHVAEVVAGPECRAHAALRHALSGGSAGGDASPAAGRESRPPSCRPWRPITGSSRPSGSVRHRQCE